MENNHFYRRIELQRHGRAHAAGRPLHGDACLACSRQVLVPELATAMRVSMDKLSAHKVMGARQVIDDSGARLLYLPPCWPDFNPIEMALSKVKTTLRKAAVRTIPDLWEISAELIKTFRPEPCKRYFLAAGYGLG